MPKPDEAQKALKDAARELRHESPPSPAAQAAHALALTEAVDALTEELQALTGGKRADLAEELEANRQVLTLLVEDTEAAQAELRELRGMIAEARAEVDKLRAATAEPVKP